ncbi:hypothetical protein [Denitratisoma oestradiolicum]|uniref:Uncharacterized protein n=1 Tax=Denitratisoma oestradiolicum TaxID=311182 RepID=A0A6S6Y878_9PROT|nr:hypothetical protein [Denitratisoma oestradiolicum]TWO81557.1 hypothetical protein CBW56_04920 [Denitratisoma oestradiolicum]CAB1368658.1 conserved membrane protein of unknown function [Denitratisoma oestradiolicum]
MAVRQALRRHYAALVTSGAQLLLLFVAAESESREGWLVCLGLMALISLFAWMSALRRLRAVRDTPTSRVASAAQGYVELIGRGRPLDGAPLLSKLSALPCLWYRYQVERRDSDNKWRTEDKGESQDSFLLDDGSAACVVDPYGAEILTQHRDVWQQGDYRYTEWKLLDIDTIYAIGQFRTLGGGSSEINTNEELKAVLAEWKLDSRKLHERFDLDGNGVLDMKEWSLARQAAKREAKKRVAEVRAMPDTHYMVQPHDDRLFLISNLPPDQLAHRYGFWAWGHLLIFFSSLGGMGWLLGWGGSWAQ